MSDTVNLAVEVSPLRALRVEATSFGALEVLGPTPSRTDRTSYLTDLCDISTFSLLHFHPFVVLLAACSTPLKIGLGGS